MTIYDVQNAQKTPIWKQRIIECRSSGMSVKEWCKERGLNFTTYYRWEREILTSIIPTEDMPGLPAPNLPPTAGPQNAIVKVELASWIPGIQHFHWRSLAERPTIFSWYRWFIMQDIILNSRT